MAKAKKTGSGVNLSLLKDILAGSKAGYVDDIDLHLFVGTFDLAVPKSVSSQYETLLDNFERIDSVSDLGRGRVAYYVQQAISTKLSSGDEFELSDVEGLLATFNSFPQQEFRIVRDLHGARMSRASAPVELMGVKVYDWQNHKHLIIDMLPEEVSKFWKGTSHQVLIEKIVKARSPDRAIQLADEYFFQFENVLRFALWCVSPFFDVRVSGSAPIAVGVKNSYVIADRAVQSRFEHVAPTPILDLDGSWSSELKEAGFWKLSQCADSFSTPMQETILRSAEWVGQSLADPIPRTAFVKASIALESIFTGKNDPTGPSITSKIAEGCAMVLGSSAANARAIEARVKVLYRIRSEIVHGGKVSVSKWDLRDLRYILKEVIRIFLNERSYASLHDEESFRLLMQEKKFRACRRRRKLF